MMSHTRESPQNDRAAVRLRFGVSVVSPLQLPTSSTSRRGSYSCGFDLRLDPIRLDHVGALKRLSTEEHDLEDSQQTIDSTGKDVGNCKRQPIAYSAAFDRLPTTASTCR